LAQGIPFSARGGPASGGDKLRVNGRGQAEGEEKKRRGKDSNLPGSLFHG